MWVKASALPRVSSLVCVARNRAISQKLTACPTFRARIGSQRVGREVRRMHRIVHDRYVVAVC